MSDQPIAPGRAHWKSAETWRRALFMLLFAVVFWIAEFLLLAVAVFQFGFVLMTGERNERLLSFGDDLSRVFHHLVGYLTFQTEEKPFPFSDWPGLGPQD